MEALKKKIPFGKFSGPKLSRSDAIKNTDFDHSESLGRSSMSRRGGSRAAVGDVPDANDMYEDLPTVYSTQDVVFYNYYLRSGGVVDGPATLGISAADWEAQKNSPNSDLGRNSPAEGGGFTFHPEPDSNPTNRVSSKSSPSLSPPHTPSVTSSSTPRQPAVSSSSTSPRQPAVSSTSTSPREAAGHAEDATAQPSRFPEAAPRSSSDVDRRFSRMDIREVVSKAMAQNQRNLLESAEVSSFIQEHGGEELPRTESVPANLASSYDLEHSRGAHPSNRVAKPSGGIQIVRTISEPLPASSSTSGDEIEIGFETTVAAEALPRARSDISRGRQNVSPVRGTTDSFQKKGQQAKTGSLAGSLSGSLKPPPPMNRSMLQPAEFSTHDIVVSLAPDSTPDIAASESEAEEEEPAECLEESTTSSGPVSQESEVESKDRQNDAGRAVFEEPPRNPLTVEVPRVQLEHLAAVVGQNPSSDLSNVIQPDPSFAPKGPNFPWTKGEFLGQGSFGTVYEAVDSDGMFFAVKEVSLLEKDKQAQQSVSQLMQEVDLLSRFKHDNIVHYLGTDRADGKLYIFLELVPKGSLASICKRISLSDSQISAYTRQILKGLKFLHDQNIMHRDIKCANILVDTKGICKLADFGMAKQISSVDQGKSTKGSAYWMAPEVIDPKKTYGNPADIWSLGCSVLEMSTGSPPFGDMEWYRVLWTVGHGNAPPIPESLSERAKDFVKHCLEINPMKRPTATELLEHPFVRQSQGMTPTSSGQMPPMALKHLESIKEERSQDLLSGSSDQPDVS